MAWNGSGGSVGGQRTAARPRHRALKWLAAALAFSAAGVVFWLLSAGRLSSPAGVDSPRRVGPIKTVAPSLARDEGLPQTNVEDVVSGKHEGRMERGLPVVSESIRTNQSGAVIEKLTLSDGRVIEKVRPPKPIFDNASDELIAMALSAKPGQYMAPLPDLSSIDRDFAISLLNPIRVNDDDSDEVKNLKYAVMEARAYIASEVKNGRRVQDCLYEHRAQMEEISDRHLMAVQEIQRMKEEGAPAEDIAAFRQRINDVFRAQGIPELPTPLNHASAQEGIKDE